MRVIFVFAIFLLVSCKNESTVTRSAYWWKTAFQWNQNDSITVHKLGLSKLYIRYFDVSSEPTGILPIAPIRGLASIPSEISVIPVVYITIDALRAMDDSSAVELAEKIVTMVQRMHTSSNQPLNEIQIDCDWTISTQKKYFALLTAIKKSYSGSVSATIRLHQIKFVQKSGIPPVDRGMLMFYNMGDPGKTGETNSIIDYPLIDSYTKKLSSYAIPLDFAFPLFSWGVLFRDDAMVGLIRDLSRDDLNESTIVSKIAPNRWKVQESGTIARVSVQTGDIIRLDDSSPKTVLRAARVAARRHNDSSRQSISFFQWDSTQINRFSTQNIVRLYEQFQ